jgi:hypothetical protein
LVGKKLMNPYRDARVVVESVRPRRSPFSSPRKTAGLFLATVSAMSSGPLACVGKWALACAGLCALFGVALMVIGRSRTPLTRLCALTWNRGDRFGAAMLFFGVVTPRYSAKRIARQRAALAAVQARCIKYRSRWIP